jgi:DTW domain-containing protein YfiP
MDTRTRVVLLMHPKEYRRQKCTTGRLATLHLAASEILPGIAFDDHPRVRALVEDPGHFAVLLYPGADAIDVADGPALAARAGARRLVVFLIDATWHCARTVARCSPSLLSLPRLMIHPRAPSRFTIKRQPAPWCLSTIEAIHELLLGLEGAGMDTYPDRGRLLAAFHAMQDYQVAQIRAAGGRAVRGVRARQGAEDRGRQGAEDRGRVSG